MSAQSTLARIRALYTASLLNLDKQHKQKFAVTVAFQACIASHVTYALTYSDDLCLSQVKRNGKILTNPDEDANATSSAPDGDLDAAYALLLAGRKWQHKPYTESGVKVIGVGLLTAWHHHR